MPGNGENKFINGLNEKGITLANKGSTAASKVEKGSKRITGVSIIIFIVCLTYMELALVNGSWLGKGLQHLIEHWLGLAFAIFAFVMLFAVDRRKWAEKFEYNRRVNNFMLVLAPCVAETLEPFREMIFNLAESHREWLIFLMIFVVWALLNVLVFYLEERFHINERTNIT